MYCFVPYVTWSFGLCLKMLNMCCFVPYVTQRFGLHLKALEYVLFHTICYQTIPYAMKSYLKAHVHLYYWPSK